MSAVSHGPTGDIERSTTAPFHYAFHHDVPDEFVRLPEPTESDGWHDAMAELLPGADTEAHDAASFPC
ncbi:hypothetical protein [Streptomyces coelicoflavus]|uniref:hypothetical protein n=1 Tax=Streptomyces coelicoflavus TaxID=285562 RepID=UPI002E268E7A